MTITREQVAELQPGDVVQLHDERWPAGTNVCGPLWEKDGNLLCGHTVIRWLRTGPARSIHLELRVIARAARPAVQVAR